MGWAVLSRIQGVLIVPKYNTHTSLLFVSYTRLISSRTILNNNGFNNASSCFLLLKWYLYM